MTRKTMSLRRGEFDLEVQGEGKWVCAAAVNRISAMSARVTFEVIALGTRTLAAVGASSRRLRADVNALSPICLN